MRKSLAIFLLAAFAACALHTADLRAGIIAPIGLAPGSEYQLIFVTAGNSTAESTQISTYNAFVSAQAALNPSLPSATWKDVGSTSMVDASTNAPNIMVGGSYLPVYNTAGILVSSEASGGLYSGSLLSAVLYDQYEHIDEPPMYSSVWTGSTSGTQGAPYVLGGDPTYDSTWTGDSSTTSSGWLGGSEGVGQTFYELPLYALSSALTVPSPEPATITLLGSALSLLAGFRLLKRRRAV